MPSYVYTTYLLNIWEQFSVILENLIHTITFLWPWTVGRYLNFRYKTKNYPSESITFGGARWFDCLDMGTSLIYVKYKLNKLNT